VAARRAAGGRDLGSADGSLPVLRVTRGERKRLRNGSGYACQCETLYKARISSEDGQRPSQSSCRRGAAGAGGPGRWITADDIKSGLASLIWPHGKEWRNISRHPPERSGDQAQDF